MGTHRMPELATGLPKTRAAIAYAQRRHAGQRRRSDGAEFIEHPLEVGSLLYDAGSPDHVIAAGVLHDTIEKTDATAAELHERFGSEVADLVLAVTEDSRIPGYQARKAALRKQVAAAGEEALVVFAADKISKVRELSSVQAREGRSRQGLTAAQARRLTHYRHSRDLLEDHLAGSPLVPRLRAELDALTASLSLHDALAESH
jgi:(p)ppGpp synthase/HD superfamily hydrolase